jgi:hypothetical protein
MRSTPRLAAAILATAVAAGARADVVEMSSTTLLQVGQQTRGGLPGQKPDLVTVTPAFEIVTLTARQVSNPLVEDLEIVLSTWGAYDLSDVRWDAGTTGNLTGDITTGYVRGRLAGGRVALRLGRAYVVAGAGRMLQLDGGDLLARLPGGVTASAFAGLPVSQRFSTRDGLRSWNPSGGDLAYGGRLGWSLPFAGVAGRGLDLGVSAVFVQDGGDPVRQDVGIDLRLQPVGHLVLAGHGVYGLTAQDLFSGMPYDASLVATWDVTRALFLSLDYRFTRPDLFLSRTSILSVFSDSDRTDLGGGVRYRLSPAVSVGADYHALFEPGATAADGTEVGNEAAVRAEWEHAGTVVGAEATYLDVSANGYTAFRAWGKRGFGRFDITGDVQAHFLREEVNGEKTAVTGALSASWAFAPSWAVTLAGRAGMTPLLEQQADAMVKLVYNPTIRVREVR